jgi:hypothetical protein
MNRNDWVLAFPPIIAIVYLLYRFSDIWKIERQVTPYGDGPRA